MDDQETVTLSREQWDEVRRAILYTKRQTRSVERIKVLEEAYEQMVNQGSDQATDKHMAEWRARNDAAAQPTAAGIESLRRAVQRSL